MSAKSNPAARSVRQIRPRSRLQSRVPGRTPFLRRCGKSFCFWRRPGSIPRILVIAPFYALCGADLLACRHGAITTRYRSLHAIERGPSRWPAVSPKGPCSIGPRWVERSVDSPLCNRSPAGQLSGSTGPTPTMRSRSGLRAGRSPWAAAKTSGPCLRRVECNRGAVRTVSQHAAGPATRRRKAHLSNDPHAPGG